MEQTRTLIGASIYEITLICQSFFEQIVAEDNNDILAHRFPVFKHDADGRKVQLSCSFLDLRDSFDIWIEDNRAHDLLGSSLDTKLQEMADIRASIVESLEVILVNLHANSDQSDDLRKLSQTPTAPDPTDKETFFLTWISVGYNIGTALDQLHLAVQAMKNAPSRKLDHTIATLFTNEDELFRIHIVDLVRDRFPAARRALSSQLGDSIAVRRCLLLQQQRWAKTAVRHRPESPLTPHLKPELPSNPQVNHVEPSNDPTMLAPGSSKVTPMSPTSPGPTNTWAEIARPPMSVVDRPKNTQDDSFEYPPMPTVDERRLLVQCPFCFTHLDCIGLEEPSRQDWELHLKEKIKPYSCLFPECADSLPFFSCRWRWQLHMEAHEKEWLRKVHTLAWYCDRDHDEPIYFETESEWRAHMETPTDNPKHKPIKLTEDMIQDMSKRSRRYLLRERFACPLCEKVPEEIRLRVENALEDPQDLYKFLLDHLADHMISLAQLAVPCLENIQVVRGTPIDSVRMIENVCKRSPRGEQTAGTSPPSGDASASVHGERLPSVTETDTKRSLWAETPELPEQKPAVGLRGRNAVEKEWARKMQLTETRRKEWADSITSPHR